MEDWKILTHDRIQSLIEANLDNDPVRFALTQSNNEIPVALVSKQLKSLQKARSKLPLWYQKRAILPPLALEQCSSEATARLKKYLGARALDLSGGLGVDSYFLSQGFSHFVTLEVNSPLAEIQRYNLKLLHNDKIQVINQSAEDYLAQYKGPRFDLIYVDPSRRGEHNQRINALTEGRPNILQLLPLVRKHARQLLIKASPLLDLDEAYRLFPQASTLKVVSLNNECKEVLILIENLDAALPTEIVETRLQLQLLRGDCLQEYEFAYPLAETGFAERSSLPSFLAEPDVAFYKARALGQLWERSPKEQCTLPHPDSYFFCDTALPQDFPGRQFRVLEAMPYKPRQLKKWLKQKGLKRLNLSKRNFPESIQQIRRQLQLAEGGDQFLLFSMWQGQRYAFFAERI